MTHDQLAIDRHIHCEALALLQDDALNQWLAELVPEEERLWYGLLQRLLQNYEILRSLKAILQRKAELTSSTSAACRSSWYAAGHADLGPYSGRPTIEDVFLWYCLIECAVVALLLYLLP